MTTRWKNWISKLGLASWLMFVVTITTFSGDYALVQLAPDATLRAESSSVIPVTRFREFSVAVKRGAYFFNPNTDIQNIVSAPHETRLLTTNSSAFLFNQTEDQIMSNKSVVEANSPRFVEPEKELILKTLECHSTAASGNNPDQISLYVEDRLVWDSVTMNAKDKEKLPPVNKIFDERVRIRLFNQSGQLRLGRHLRYREWVDTTRRRR